MRETGRRFPDVSLLPALAETLGVSISELVMGERLEVHEENAAALMDAAVINSLARSKRETALEMWRHAALPALLMLAAGAVLTAMCSLLYREVIMSWSDIPADYVLYGEAVFVLIPLAAPAAVWTLRRRFTRITRGKTFPLAVLAALALFFAATALWYDGFYTALFTPSLAARGWDDTAVEEVLRSILPWHLAVTLAVNACCCAVSLALEK